MRRLAQFLVVLMAALSYSAVAELADADLVAEAKEAGLWSHDKSFGAVSIAGISGTRVYVLLLQPSGEYVEIDVSRIEDGLFIKLGLAERAKYEKYETTPIEWHALEGGNMQLTVRLRAWRDGQRYTVTGPVVVRSDGSLIWQ